MKAFFPSIFKVAGHIKECGTARNTISQLVFDELRFVECFRCVISLIVAFVCLNNNSVCAIKLGISYSSTKSNSSGQSSSTNDSGTSGTYSTSSLSSAQSRGHCSRKFINFHLNAMRYSFLFYVWSFCLSIDYAVQNHSSCRESTASWRLRCKLFGRSAAQPTICIVL